MSERMVINRIKKIRELQGQVDALMAEIDRVKGQIQDHMTQQGVDELDAGGFVVRWKTVITKRFDSKAFKAAHEALYNLYTKQSESRRFTIA